MNGAPEFFSPQVTKARRFYLDLSPPKHRRLSVICGGLELCQSDYAIHRVKFPFYSVEYVARGQGELKLKGRSYTLQPGWLFSYGPGVPHHIIGSQSNPLVKYFVDFTGTSGLNLLRSCGLGLGRAARIFPPNALVPLFDELIQSGLKVSRRSADLCVRLLECVALKIANAKAPVEGAESQAFVTYQQCREYIEEHFLSLRTLVQIADGCHADKAYLCRLFQRYDQLTPYQCLLRLKINHASVRLLQPNILIKQVAEEVGFADPLHFSRIFKAVLGLSPDAFRRVR
jgi:AraC-like DNA-binding protein